MMVTLQRELEVRTALLAKFAKRTEVCATVERLPHTELMISATSAAFDLLHDTNASNLVNFQVQPMAADCGTSCLQLYLG